MTRAVALAVAPERLDRWLSGVEERHGQAEVTVSPDHVVLRCPDGAIADLGVPFGPLVVDPADRYGGLVAHATADRLVGLLLLRRGGVAVGVAEGERLVESKVERRRVQSRTAAGGWSQQRFARRRQNQATELVGVAADLAARLLVPRAGELAALVEGGDRLLLRALHADPRLAPLWERPAGPRLPVPDPRLEALQQAAVDARAVRVSLVEPGA